MTTSDNKPLIESPHDATDSSRVETIAAGSVGSIKPPSEIVAPSTQTFMVQTSRGISSQTVTFGERSSFRQLLLEWLSESPDLGERYRNFAYTSPADFLQRHAKLYTGNWTDQWKKGPRQDAFLSAMAMTISHGLRYIEGVALVEMPFRKGRFVCTPHAWNADGGEALVDVSTSNEGLAYLGVEFSVERVYEAGRDSRCGLWSVIDDAEHDQPLLRRPWQGEKPDDRFPHAGELYMLHGRPFNQVRASLRNLQKRAYEAAERKREEALRRPRPQTAVQIQASITRVKTAYERYCAGEEAEESAFRMSSSEIAEFMNIPLEEVPMDYDSWLRDSRRRDEMVSVLWHNHGCGQDPDCEDSTYGYLCRRYGFNFEFGGSIPEWVEKVLQHLDTLATTAPQGVRGGSPVSSS